MRHNYPSFVDDLKSVHTHNCISPCSNQLYHNEKHLVDLILQQEHFVSVGQYHSSMDPIFFTKKTLHPKILNNTVGIRIGSNNNENKLRKI